ncbi:MAG: ribosome silencing factor [Oscillospiraceae bacterium]|nr:ribosome silencing factor [Oscillospiraceae bacterium]
MLNEKEMVSIAVKALDNKQGKDIKVLRTADQTTLADYFVICNGTSNTQVRALADAVEEAMSKAGEEPHHIEGHRGNQWTLMDYSAVVIHIFTEEGREFYGLERLWSDAEAVDIADFLTAEAE